MIIREEQFSDIEPVWQVNNDAFDTDTEARLVNALRSSGCEYISLVAEIDHKVIGHILFTPVKLTGNENTLKIMALAPMAVCKLYQNKGVGSELVKAGLTRCRELGYDAVVVLGHPGYYPKFGFIPSVNYNIKSEYDVPDNVFMILELTPGSLEEHHQGIIKYHDAFNNV
ncbi:MAG: N-acetyltransferase [Gammaproteobacteria bacterium]